ncbi:MAG: hypothetical protein QM755_22570 [Luteolibacter sp.]
MNDLDTFRLLLEHLRAKSRSGQPAVIRLADLREPPLGPRPGGPDRIQATNRLVEILYGFLLAGSRLYPRIFVLNGFTPHREATDDTILGHHRLEEMDGELWKYFFDLLISSRNQDWWAASETDLSIIKSRFNQPAGCRYSRRLCEALFPCRPSAALPQLREWEQQGWLWLLGDFFTAAADGIIVEVLAPIEGHGKWIGPISGDLDTFSHLLTDLGMRADRGGIWNIHAGDFRKASVGNHADRHPVEATSQLGDWLFQAIRISADRFPDLIHLKVRELDPDFADDKPIGNHQLDQITPVQKAQLMEAVQTELSAAAPPESSLSLLKTRLNRAFRIGRTRIDRKTCDHAFPSHLLAALPRLRDWEQSGWLRFVSDLATSEPDDIVLEMLAIIEPPPLSRPGYDPEKELAVLTATINRILDDTADPLIPKSCIFPHEDIRLPTLHWLKDLEARGILKMLADPVTAMKDEMVVEMLSYIDRESPIPGFLNYRTPAPSRSRSLE